MIDVWACATAAAVAHVFLRGKPNCFPAGRLFQAERTSRIVVGALAVLAVIVFVWMHLHMFVPETLASLLHSMLRVDLFFLVVMFALTMYLRQVMNHNTRTILRALANTRSRP